MNPVCPTLIGWSFINDGAGKYRSQREINRGCFALLKALYLQQGRDVIAIRWTQKKGLHTKERIVRILRLFVWPNSE